MPTAPAPLQVPPRSPFGRVRLSVVVLAPALLQAFCLYEFYNYGPLSGFTPWDDCLFVLRGLHNLDVVAHATSLVGLLGSAPRIYIHSPIADLQTFVGLLLTGGHTWGAYALGATWLMLVVYAVLRVCGPSRALAAALLIFVLIQPMAMSSFYLKADWKGGIMMAAAIYVLNEAGRRDDDGLKTLGASLLSLALLTKLSAFYLPALGVIIVALFDVASVLAFQPRDASLGHVVDAYRAGSGRFRGLMTRIGIAVLPFILLWMVTWLTGENIVAYIRNALSDTWSDHLSLVQRASFYSPLSGDGQLAWGSIPGMFSLGLIACAAQALTKRRWAPLAPLGLVIAIAILVLIPLVLAHVSDITFAATLLGVIMGGAMIAMTRVCEDNPRGGLAVLAVSVVLASTLRLTPMSAYYGLDHSLPSSRELRDTKTSYMALVRYMMQSTPDSAPGIRVFFEYLWAPYPNLAIESFRMSGRMTPIWGVRNLADPALPGQMAATHFALTFAPRNPSDGPLVTGLETRYPTSANPAKADAFVAAQPNFQRAMTIQVRGGEVRLYVNRALVKPAG